jgi:hypothetical protein
MADEATIQNSLQIRKVDATSGAVVLEHRSTGPTSFNVDVSGTKGPTPGAITVTTEGTDVDLSELTIPGLCEIHNQDGTNFVEVGIWDPEVSKFYPLDEVGPGEKYTRKLSRNLQEEFMTGTGTTGADTNRLRLKADTDSCEVYVGAFEA